MKQLFWAVAALIIGGSCFGAWADDPPEYNLVVFKSGSGQFPVKSVRGVAPAENGRASLQALVLTSGGSDFDSAGISFKLSCVFVRYDNQLPDRQGPLDMNQWCPQKSSTESKFLQSFKIELVGPNATPDKFFLSYQCLSYLSNGTRRKPFGWMGAGGWCGEESNQPIAWWISGLEIKLEKRP